MSASGPRRVALHQRHAAAGAHLVDFAGWEMPQHYTSVREEQYAVRTAAGLFDVSHMGRFELTGEAAGSFLQGVVSNDLSRVGAGQAQYNLLCNEAGGVVDDLVVYRRGDQTWTVVVNASNCAKDLAWLEARMPAGVQIRDVSQEIGLLALQGPGAQGLLPAAGTDLDAIPYFGMAEGSVAGVPALISRTGYTGEDGFELFVATPDLPTVWDSLLEAGAVPCGLAARDVCRLEAGLRLYGTDMDETTNPYDAGLGWTVKLDKGAFVGRDALAAVREAGPSRGLVGLRGVGRLIPRHGAAVSRDGAQLGAVTGGTHSFWLNAGIGMAMLARGAAKPGQSVEVESRAGSGEATVERLPFYRGSVRAPASSPKV